MNTLLLLLIFLVIFIVIGVPLAFAISASAVTYLFFVSPFPLTVVAQRMVDGVNSFTLLALPLFVLTGSLMEKGGAVERLMLPVRLVMGKFVGGMAVATVMASAFFGFIYGSGVAATAAIGRIMMPEMVRSGYGKGYTAVLVAAASVLAIIIPPSLAMVVAGVAGGISIGDLFLGGIVPGMVCAALISAAAVLVARRRGYKLRDDAITDVGIRQAVTKAFFPLLAPAIILGGIYAGIFTPTESASVAAVYALGLGLWYRQLTLASIFEAFRETTILSGVILLIIAASTPFAWIVAINQVPSSLTHLFQVWHLSPLAVTAITMIIFVILGTFMETISIIVIFAPIFVPIFQALGIPPVEFGVLMMIALAIGGVSPPVAVNLITASSILGIRLEETFSSLPPFLVAMVAALVITIAIPSIALWPVDGHPHASKNVGVLNKAYPPKVACNSNRPHEHPWRRLAANIRADSNSDIVIRSWLTQMPTCQHLRMAAGDPMPQRPFQRQIESDYEPAS